MANLNEVTVTAKRPQNNPNNKQYGKFYYSANTRHWTDRSTGKVLPNNNIISYNNGTFWNFGSDGNVRKVNIPQEVKNHLQQLKEERGGDSVPLTEKLLSTLNNNFQRNKVTEAKLRSIPKETPKRWDQMPLRNSKDSEASNNRQKSFKKVEAALHGGDRSNISQSTINQWKEQKKINKSNEISNDLEKGLVGTLATLPAAYVAPTLVPILNSPVVQAPLTAYTVYDGAKDISKNGLNVGNALEVAGGVLPSIKYLNKVPIANQALKSVTESLNKNKLFSKVTNYFNPTQINKEAEALASVQKTAAAPISKRINLVARNAAPNIVKKSANTVQDLALGIGASKFSNNYDKLMDYDENGNPIQNWKYKFVQATKPAVQAAAFTIGLGARKGITGRDLLTGTVAYGPGMQATEYVTDKILPDGHIKQFVNYTLPAIMHRELDYGLLKAGTKDAIIAGNAKTAAADALIQSSIALPASYAVNNILPKDMSNRDAIVSQFGQVFGARTKPKEILGHIMEGTAGASKQDPKLVKLAAQNLVSRNLRKYIYTGKYNNSSPADLYKRTQNGSIFGNEGFRQKYRYNIRDNFKKIARFDFKHLKPWWKPIRTPRASGYEESSYVNYSEPVQESNGQSWWLYHTGAQTPKVGTEFGKDSKVVRYTNKVDISANDLVSKMYRYRSKGLPLIEIRANSAILGNKDVPKNLQLMRVEGVNRSDKFFTGPSKEALNTAGANLAFYGKNGKIDGIQIVDYTAPGVRRISPGEGGWGKFAYLMGHPINATKYFITGNQKYAPTTDNYYNGTGNKTGFSGAAKYIGATWGTSLAESLQRQHVFSTTGYLALKEVTPEQYTGKGKYSVRRLLFGQDNPAVGTTVKDIQRHYKGTSLQNATFGQQLYDFYNNYYFNKQ